MALKSQFIYLRGLRQVDHTVFCVSDGQKTYRDPATNRQLPYSSGQQVKRSILDEMALVLDENRAPITFNFTLATAKDGKKTFGQEEPWSPCDPAFADQLIGGWMKASKGGKEGAPIKRRSPLSISAMRPLHPSLAGVDTTESATFDRSDQPEQHKIRVLDGNGNEVSKDEFLAFLQSESRNVSLRKWIPSDQVGPRATGLFVFDVAIDLRTLFSVSLNTLEPELAPDKIAELKAADWQSTSDGTRLICPETRRNAIIPALAHSLVYWRVTSNQSRTYSPQNTLAIARSNNANRLSMAIRADLTESSEYRRAEPVLEPTNDVSLYTALTAKGYIREIEGSVDALDRAVADLAAELKSFDYDYGVAEMAS